MGLDEGPLRCPGHNFLCQRVFSISLNTGGLEASVPLQACYPNLWALPGSAGTAWPHGGARPRV